MPESHRAGPAVVVCPNSRQRVGDGNEIDFDVHGRNTALRGAEPASTTCPEALSTINTTHYRHVLRICRRFFRQPEDTEDAAAEVFLKLHKVLETRDRRCLSAVGVEGDRAALH